ncbi:ArsI/CadI family heavy metal resistance metalloenzyme [uncultured Erythrobacter sp.]|uniref:ArsI/CadI family heavy metal resistance metalloenzyme n=1 Tax=uncultured Erythrobacter sp. TaxID=263913 RepID=UPI00262C30EA|nr:ArsI/CadI family heavy metal resistance metalloenzyme [uncultured Erythrobacter sp.]
MKRLHVSLGVSDLAASTRFYSAMFGHAPTLERDGYAQWELEDPSVNFVIEASADRHGVTHLGVQASNEQELQEQYTRVDATGHEVLDQGDTQCCYAKSTKNWVSDPDGTLWETFQTHSRSDEYGEVLAAEQVPAPQRQSAGCC